MRRFGINTIRSLVCHLTVLASCMWLTIPALAQQLAEQNETATPQTATIDLLVVYNQATAEAYSGQPQSRFVHLAEVANQIYVDSGVNLRLNVVHSVLVDYPEDLDAETALRDITFGNAPFESIAGLRESYNADMVVFYRPYNDAHGSCGLAWLGGTGSAGDFSAPEIRDYQYSHIAINSCGDYITAHELGHNLGLAHSRRQDGEGGVAPYALGHGEDYRFTTIMAYHSAFNVGYWEGKVYKFSNPDIDCMGSPCGIQRDLPDGADARFALNITGPQVANFYGGNTAVVATQLQSVHSQVEAARDSYEQLVSEYDNRLAEIENLELQQTEARDQLTVATGKAQQSLSQFQQAVASSQQAMVRAAAAGVQVQLAYSLYQAAEAHNLQQAYTRYQSFEADYQALDSRANTLLSEAEQLQTALAQDTRAVQAASDILDTLDTALSLADQARSQLELQLDNALQYYQTLENQYQALFQSTGIGVY